jgi:arginine-tRNA-protein transferase
MTDQPTRFPRFFVTAESPCPYLPGRTERKVFAELRGPDAQRMSEGLGRIGFRRSQNVVYRPSCEGCNACVSVRVVANQFHPSPSQRRLLKRNADLDVAACDPWATEEQFDLLRRYLKDRHPTGGMASMDGYDFAEMIETSPVDTVVVCAGQEANRTLADELLAAGVAVDVIGGAHIASELDAVRAIDEGTRLAYAL